MTRLANDERGFTLIEMLLVLMVVVVISSGVLFFAKEKLVTYTEYQLMNQIELVFRMAQMTAVEKKSPVIFEARYREKIQVRMQNKQDLMYEQYLPEHIKIYLESPSIQVTFNTKGNVSGFGNLYYHYPNLKVNYTINIGKGRIIMRKTLYD